MVIHLPPPGKTEGTQLTVFPNEAQGGSKLELDGRINFRFADYEPVPIRIRQFIGMAPEVAKGLSSGGCRAQGCGLQSIPMLLAALYIAVCSN